MASEKTDTKKIILRNQLWPDATEVVWDYHNSPGWLNVPRTMPIILRTMDSLSTGKPISNAYLDLWCRTFNDGFVDAARTGEMAFFSGFDGERAYRTWLSRIRTLEELGFIRTASGGSGDVNYALILNPYPVLAKLKKEGRIQDRFWNALLARMIEIGATDLDAILASDQEN